MENNNRIVNEIEALLSTKLDELITLQGTREELRDSMANPDTINENAFDINEKQRQLHVLEEVRDYAAETMVESVDEAVDLMLENHREIIKHREEQGHNVTEERLNYNSLKIVSEEIKSTDSDSEGNNDDNDDASGSMDISSSDDLG